MVLAQLGNGGKGGAVTNRANMFDRAGHKVTIVVLNYEPGLEKTVKKNRNARLIEPGVRVVNLFENVAAFADLSSQRSMFQRIRKDRRSLRAPTLSSELGLSRDIVFESDDDGRVVRAWKYDQGQPTVEAYFTPNGRLFARRFYKKGKASAVEAYDPVADAIERFGNLAQWQASWLCKLVEAEESPPVILCDSQAKMAPILTHIKPDLAKRIGILHANHFNEPPYARGSAVKPNERRFLSRLEELDALVTLTQTQADDIAEEYGHADRIHVIPNVVKDLPETGVGGPDKRLTIFCRLVESKRISDVIAAFNKVVEAAPGATLDVFGDGRDRGRLQELIDEKGLTKSVKLRGSTSRVDDEMSASTATVFPSDTDGFGMAIAQSMMAGTPAISFDVNYGPAELIDDGVDGLLVPHSDVDSLAAAIIELLNDPGRAQHMGARARVKIRAQYSEDVIMAKWQRLLDRVQQA